VKGDVGLPAMGREETSERYWERAVTFYRYPREDWVHEKGFRRLDAPELPAGVHTGAWYEDGPEVTRGPPTDAHLTTYWQGLPTFQA